MKNKITLVAALVFVLSLTIVFLTYFFVSRINNSDFEKSISTSNNSTNETKDETGSTTSNQKGANDPTVDSVTVEMCAGAKKMFEEMSGEVYSNQEFDALISEGIERSGQEGNVTKFESCVLMHTRDLGPIEGTAFGIKHLGAERFEELTELMLQQSRENLQAASKRAFLGSLSSSIWLCLDQGGWNPPENNQLVCEGQKSTWPDLSTYGDTWGGCAFDVRENVKETGYYVQYCITQANGDVQRCTEEGCETLRQ